MRYIYQYDVAALVLSLIIFFSFILRKRIYTRVSKAFEVLTIDLIAACVFDLITIVTISYPQLVPIWVNYVLNIICLLTYNMLPPLFYFCIYAASSNQRKKFLIAEKHILLLPAIISILVIITTPITKSIFSFDAEGYHVGSVYGLLDIVGAIYFILIISRTIRKSYKFNKGQIASIIVYTLAIIGSLVLQAFYPKVLTSLFFGAIADLLVYLSLDNPSDYIDPIMDIFNKKSFTVILNKLYNKKKTFRLIGIKLEQITYINETIGYGNFNNLLVMLRDRLFAISGKDNLFRVSNGKFAIIVQQSNSDFRHIVNDIKTIMDEPFIIDDMSVTLRYKITTLDSPNSSNSTEAVIDLLCYTLDSPQAAIGAITIADAKILDKAKRELKIIQIMKKSLENDGFTVVYQPIYSVEDQKYTAVEALVRLKDPELGFLSPEEFIPLAEKNGMISQIGDIVFNQVCEYIALNKIWEKGLEYIHVNLSVIQCMSEKLYQKLFTVMDGYGIPYKYVHLEVSEATAAITSDSLRKNMYKLMDKEVFFALDDTGSILTNTARLLQYPFKTVKLDKNVIWDAMKDEKSLKLVQHTISMLNDIGIKIVAEGVETKEMADKLAQLNCNYFQGYYYSKPINGDALMELVKDQH